MPDCNGEPARYMWQQTIPQYAFTSEAVLNPTLSVAALHMKCHSAGDSQLSLAITRYLDMSLVYHRQAVKHIDTDLAEPIWLSAVVLSNLYWLISHHSRPGEKYELPLEAWDMVGGVSRLYAHRLELLTKLGYGWFGYDIVPLTLQDEDLGPERRAALQALDEDMTTLLGRFDVTSPTSSPAAEQGQGQGQTKKMYADAKAYVLLYYRAYLSGSEAKTLRRHIGTMALMLGPDYHQRLRDHDPRAMALYARMLVLMRRLDFAWWMNGEGEYEVMERDVYGMERLIPARLRWCMEWPLKVLSGEIGLPEPVKSGSES
ncbi:C6 transcription factor [Apiospora saccharicola]|uniref:C6 transcription factor n=1 Tax=Apiospora saccharicola TaxID=335842 RepID=A0ABR1U1G9_9PEZI